MLGGLLALLAFTLTLVWIAFSFWVGGKVLDATGNIGIAILVTFFLLLAPFVFLVGVGV